MASRIWILDGPGPCHSIWYLSRHDCFTVTMALVCTVSPRRCWHSSRPCQPELPGWRSVPTTFKLPTTPVAAGPMDNYHVEDLRDYTAVTDEALHSYLIEQLRTGMIYIRPRRRGPETVGLPMSTKQLHSSASCYFQHGLPVGGRECCPSL